GSAAGGRWRPARPAAHGAPTSSPASWAWWPPSAATPRSRSRQEQGGAAGPQVAVTVVAGSRQAHGCIGMGRLDHPAPTDVDADMASPPRPDQAGVEKQQIPGLQAAGDAGRLAVL